MKEWPSAEQPLTLFIDWVTSWTTPTAVAGWNSAPLSPDGGSLSGHQSVRAERKGGRTGSGILVMRKGGRLGAEFWFRNNGKRCGLIVKHLAGGQGRAED